MIKNLKNRNFKLSGHIVIIFTNYFKNNLCEVQSLKYENQLSNQNGLNWKMLGWYSNVNMKNKEIVSEFDCLLQGVNNIKFSFSETWEPLDFYLSNLEKEGFEYEVYSDFSGRMLTDLESEYVIVNTKLKEV